MKFLRKILKRIVSKRAGKNYLNACKLAEKRYLESRHTPQFVISHPDNECKLMVCTMDEFKAFRKQRGIKSEDLTLSMLRRGCWYRTCNKRGVDKMDARDLMRRKMTYVHMCLESNHLLDSQNE